ncbi:glycosyltransferase family 2 protein [Pontiellaceae bacterium B1224]|nr:glycosyltransferase family 2 protein [Pontiellaceae bacterium B1224]
MREKLSVCIIAFNEEDKIGRCLESLTWCDEIIVVDSNSTDRTREISRQFTDKVIVHEWMGFSRQKEFAWEQAENPWILWLDADEAVSPELKDEICAKLDGNSNEAGYRLPRMVYFMNRWIKHGDWYPDLNIRLFKKSETKIVHSDVHERVDVKGAIGTLHHPILHWPFDSISDLLLKADQYSSLAAEGTFKTAGFFDLFFRPGFNFFRGYFIKRGFLDGLAGLVIAWMNAASVSFKYAKRLEKQINKDPVKPESSF